RAEGTRRSASGRPWLRIHDGRSPAHPRGNAVRRGSRSSWRASEQEAGHAAAHLRHQVGIFDQVEGLDQGPAAEVVTVLAVAPHQYEEGIERGGRISIQQQAHTQLVTRLVVVRVAL